MFAGHELEIVLPFRRPVPSITSNYLSYPGPTTGKTHVDKLVDSILATLDQRDAPDFVFAIDDLELANVETPDHVTRLVSDSVRRALGATPTHRAVERVRDRCSFHLLCPMLEAYFFGEPEALIRAGAVGPPLLVGSNLEDFLVGDMAFISPSEIREHPWRRPDRMRHPKRYLSFLRDLTGAGRALYKETVDGCAALATLDWPAVFAFQPPGIAFAHALFDDLADVLGLPSPFVGNPHPLTCRKPTGTLRNLD